MVYCQTFDIGVDLEAWNGLLGISADYFSRSRTGLLATRATSLPTVVGAGLPQENLNGDFTHGIDLEISHYNRIGDLNYNIKGLFSYTRTKSTDVERGESGNSYEIGETTRLTVIKILFGGMEMEVVILPTIV